MPSTRGLRGTGYGVGVGLGRVPRAGVRTPTPHLQPLPFKQYLQPLPSSLPTEVTAPACRCPHAGGPTSAGWPSVTPSPHPEGRTSVALIVGALAASLPASLLCLRAPGWSAAAALPRGPTPDDGIALNLQAAPAVVVTQYEADLAGDGWTTPEEFRPMQGGFVSSERRSGGPTARVTRPRSDRHRRSAGRRVEEVLLSLNWDAVHPALEDGEALLQVSAMDVGRERSQADRPGRYERVKMRLGDC